MSDPLIGQPVGNYQVLARLGLANTGHIYRVRHKFLKIDRAMQLLDLGTEDLRSRFAGDAEKLAAIRHKSLVRVHEHGVVEAGGYYLLIELLSGESLAAALRRDRVLPVRQALKIVRDIASGLAEAHAQGVLHRAISTRKLFLAREGGVSVAKLVSFGLDMAVTADDLKRAVAARDRVVEVPYASPEQLGQLASSEHLDARSDVYSLGLCLYEAMTGEKLFPETEPAAALAARLQSKDRSPASCSPQAGIDPDLDELVVRMLAPSRYDRPNDGHELAEELDAMLLQVRRPTRGDHPPPPRRRAPTPRSSDVVPRPEPPVARARREPADVKARHAVAQSEREASRRAAESASVEAIASAASKQKRDDTKRVSLRAEPARSASRPNEGSREPHAEETAVAIGHEVIAESWQGAAATEPVRLDLPLSPRPFTATPLAPASRTGLGPVVAVVAAVFVVGLVGSIWIAGRSEPSPATPVSSTGGAPTLDEVRLDDAIALGNLTALDDWLSTFPSSTQRERAYLALIELGETRQDVCARVARSAPDLLEVASALSDTCGR